ncbi:MAG: hypothetical protein PVF73_12585 [Bacteroidales bacterium]
MKTLCGLYTLLFFLSGALAAQYDTLKKEVYTPEKGTTERQEILDALREEVYKIHHIEVIFVVNYLKVYDGWAWVHTLPQNADGTNRYEDILGLIRKEGESWSVLEIPCAEEDNPRCITSTEFYRELINRHPGLPECILPIK